MNTTKINTVYTPEQKESGSGVSHEEWNNLTGAVNLAHTKINSIIEEIPQGGTGGEGSSDPHVSMNSKGNLSIETTQADQVGGKGGKINIEPYSDLQIKPGDDITIYSHHRPSDKQNEVAVKIMKEEDNTDVPVKLQLNAAEITLTTKDKTGDNANVMDINVNRGKNQKGYLKVRAQAIDLRCEEHGGIALQPKGEDSSHHMNKIKFEHGGGDGLEFGTFNSEKTSIYTDEYRFKKDGVWKMASRTILDNTKGLSGTPGVDVGNGKYDTNEDDDETRHYSYKKQADDFYDEFDPDDETCTTRDIIKTAAALNGHPCIHAKRTNKGNLEIATSDKYKCLAVASEQPASANSSISASLASENVLPAANSFYSLSELIALFAAASETGLTTAVNALADEEVLAVSVTVAGNAVYITFKKYAAPDIKIDSGAGLKLGGILDFGSSFNFGETDNGIEAQYKLTKKNATKDCGVLKVVAVNNHASNNLSVQGWDSTNNQVQTVTVAPGTTQVVASCALLDIILLTNYMKANNQGPWAVQL